MSAAQRFDVILLGYRNDLSRGRVLDYLAAQPASPSGPIPAAPGAVLPRAIYRNVDYDLGFRLLAPLRDRGAQVRLIAQTEERPEPAASEPAPPPRRAAGPSNGLALLALFAALFGLYVWESSAGPPAPAKPPVMSLTGPVPAGAALANIAASHLNDEALHLAGAGDFAAASDRLRAALAQEPGQPVLRSNLRTALRNWAVSEVNAAHYAEAIERAREALDLGEDGGVLSVLGVAQSRLGDWEAARKTLERAVELGGADAPAFFALGTAYRQLGKLEPAVEMLQRAGEAGARGPDFDATLAKLERELDAEWGFAELTSPHFQIGFDEGENHLAARLVLSGLEDAYYYDGHKLSFHPSLRTPVVLYPEKEFHDVTQVPSWTGGVFDGRIKLPVRGLVEDSPVLDRTLRHEFAHVLVSELSGNRAPVWLSEGVAIWAEEDTDGEREDWARRAIAGRHLLTLAELDSPFTRLPETRVPVAYAQSYLAVRAILDSGGAVHLRQLLEALGQGHTIDDAFVAALSTRLGDFEAELVRDLTS